MSILNLRNPNGTLKAYDLDHIVDIDPIADEDIQEKWDNIDPDTSIFTYATLDSPAFTGNPTAPTPNQSDSSTKVATTAFCKELVREHGGIPVGHEYFSMNPNIPEGSLPLFGGEYSRETYGDLWAWVQTQTGYCKTEAEWQALSTANNGNVPYYSDGNGTTTFRVPSLKCWVKGANGTITEIGSYLEAGLPNIEGYLNFVVSGAVSSGGLDVNQTSLSNNNRVIPDDTTSDWRTELNLPRGNSIYGNSNTVTPESIVGLWLVKAYGTVHETGSINEQQYLDDRIATLPNTFLPRAGGTMNGDVIINPAIMSADFTTTYQYANTITTRYGIKGTLSPERAICMPMAIARDNSNIDSNNEDCRYSLIETQLYPDSTRLCMRVYKNDTAYNMTELSIDYPNSGTTTFNIGTDKVRMFGFQHFELGLYELGTTDRSTATIGWDWDKRTGSQLLLRGAKSGDSSLNGRMSIVARNATESSVFTFYADGAIDIGPIWGQKADTVRPVTNNNINLGNSSYRWKQLFAGTTTISTSDERLKDNIVDVPSDVLDAWEEVNWCQFQFKDSIIEKGDSARIHNGVIAQRIKSIFESHGLDAFRYGLLCYDEWDEIPAEYEEHGEEIHPALEAGNLWSVRYEEALSMEAAYQRRRADRLETRIKALEDKLNIIVEGSNA